MSKLTAQLLRQKKCRKNSVWSDRLGEASNRLAAAYGTPSLGNYRNPLTEIFYILLSARTTEALYRRAHRRLKKQFPTLHCLAEASVGDVWDCISDAGLGRKRAVHVVEAARKLEADFGANGEARLREMPADETFEYLTNLPGLGPKSALCVMMYSLGIDVFPVDINVQRILCRMGMVPRDMKHYQAQQRIPKFVPPDRSKELHIGLVVHGRKVCLPQRPRCSNCCLAELCRTGKRVLGLNRNGAAEQNGAALSKT